MYWTIGNIIGIIIAFYYLMSIFIPRNRDTLIVVFEFTLYGSILEALRDKDGDFPIIVLSVAGIFFLTISIIIALILYSITVVLYPLIILGIIIAIIIKQTFRIKNK